MQLHLIKMSFYISHCRRHQQMSGKNQIERLLMVCDDVDGQFVT